MKAVLAGMLAAIVLAAAAAFVLDTKVQATAEERFTTTGARL